MAENRVQCRPYQFIHQDGRGVVRAGELACHPFASELEFPRAGLDIDDWVVVEQALVNRAKFLRTHVTVVDSRENLLVAEVTQVPDRLEQVAVRNCSTVQIRTVTAREESAESRQPDPRLSALQGREQNPQRGPKILVVVVVTSHQCAVSQPRHRVAFGVDSPHVVTGVRNVQ